MRKTQVSKHGKKLLKRIAGSKGFVILGLRPMEVKAFKTQTLYLPKGS